MWSIAHIFITKQLETTVKTYMHCYSLQFILRDLDLKYRALLKALVAFSLHVSFCPPLTYFCEPLNLMFLSFLKRI